MFFVQPLHPVVLHCTINQSSSTSEGCDTACIVRKTMVKLPSVGDDSSSSINYPLQFLCCGLWCTSQQAVGSSQHNTCNKSID